MLQGNTDVGPGKSQTNIILIAYHTIKLQKITQMQLYAQTHNSFNYNRIVVPVKGGTNKNNQRKDRMELDELKLAY